MRLCGLRLRKREALVILFRENPSVGSFRNKGCVPTRLGLSINELGFAIVRTES